MHRCKCLDQDVRIEATGSMQTEVDWDDSMQLGFESNFDVLWGLGFPCLRAAQERRAWCSLGAVCLEKWIDVLGCREEDGD
jgi:hypothetical protein